MGVKASAHNGKTHHLKFAKRFSVLAAAWTTFWLVFKRKGNVEVLIQPANHIIIARMRAMIAGIEGEFQEGHPLDAKIARKIPKARVGRVMTGQEARTLLKRLTR